CARDRLGRGTFDYW
nr:immunoglobulin heavy chain junction region [Macaca mulatta]MOW75427.1 immunoglobulin heavy chain junction region [Macaca mulatta]MOW76249.1 immunoglobulin heavy chain junction region [Macaca mulatta]MOW76376.1 immunoglobulin heavy chain junction region [Macaca mulatta]MOW76639.1 immunoglobulin heavy chain junction region [Macaca mulatta]